jgi:2-hydroxy-3-keto-5-methylthiopentenyl-1-phosphate phosphatase
MTPDPSTPGEPTPGVTASAPGSAPRAEPPAIPVPALAPGQPPLAFLVDYDGTIALADVSDSVMAEHVPGEWEDVAAAYDAEQIGSRRLMEWEIAQIRSDPGPLLETAARQPHDRGFVPFVRAAQAAGVPVEIVSDGFGFFIGPALARLGVPELPVATAATVFADGRAAIAFPNGHPTCFVCGTCKRARVLAHQAAGRAVVFVGDGESDRYAAGYADVVFAKRSLVQLCLDRGWPFQRWTEFVEIGAWLARTLEAWRADPTSVPGPSAKAFYCGPEAWGEGRWDPPPTSDPSGRTPRTAPIRG